MGIRDLNIKQEYRSNTDNVVNDFYIPLLSNSVSYKRSVGFFSSSALIAVSKGLVSFLKNNGTIKLVVSPELSEKDIESIREGQELREIIKKNLEKSLESVTSEKDLQRINILSHLIGKGILEIKVAFVGKYGLFHEKVGIVEDKCGDMIAFSGSMNESISAFKSNYESFDVFKSWELDGERAKAKLKAFERIWSDNEKGITVHCFTEDIIPLLSKYKKESVNYNIDEQDDSYTVQLVNEEETPFSSIKTPTNLKLRDYQEEAIDSWFEADCRGILSMATGTGKTLTAIFALTKLYNRQNNKLALIIVCPYIHLVEQWSIELEKFNINPLQGYSTSPNKNWKKKLYELINLYNQNYLDFLCVITTNSSFISDDIQTILSNIKADSLLIADEAHNFGAKNISNKLLDNITFRLGLSATIERHRDVDGTEKLYKYFGQICYEYSLSKAIQEGKLVNYYYYPIITHLNDKEYKNYSEISLKISKLNKYKDVNQDYIDMLRIERARIIAGADNKLSELMKIMQKLEDKKHILVYCGVSKSTFWNGSEELDIKQLDLVTNLIGHTLSRDVKKFTSQETIDQRIDIKKQFRDEEFDVLVAIKCLDEGVDIPEIETAIILASSTNPKEYIQRRGRVLRRSPGKDFSYIYDIITLPYPLAHAELKTTHLEHDISLVERELERVTEFGTLALNNSEFVSLRSKIKSIFKNKIMEE